MLGFRMWLGSWFQVEGFIFKFQGPDFRFQIPCSTFNVLVVRCHTASCSWFQVSGFKCQARQGPDLRLQVSPWVLRFTF